MRVLQVASLRSVAARSGTRDGYFVLQAGYNVLLSDCDVVFLDNPFTTLINSQLQVRARSPTAILHITITSDCDHERCAFWPQQGQDRYIWEQVLGLLFRPP